MKFILFLLQDDRLGWCDQASFLDVLQGDLAGLLVEINRAPLRAPDVGPRPNTFNHCEAVSTAPLSTMSAIVLALVAVDPPDPADARRSGPPHALRDQAELVEDQHDQLGR